MLESFRRGGVSTLIATNLAARGIHVDGIDHVVNFDLPEDPETFVLAPAESNGEEPLERVLDLLPDVPAGKLAIAELPAASADDVGALERAGFDGVIVEPRSVADLVGDAPPDV